MITKLLGFDIPAIISGLLFPFPDPSGGFMRHIRLKVFPTLVDRSGHAIKYLQPKHSGVRLYFPLMALGRYLAARGGVDDDQIVKFRPKVLLVQTQSDLV